eukprot:UN23031
MDPQLSNPVSHAFFPSPGCKDPPYRMK